MCDTTSVYSDAFLEALGAWQRGWREDPIRRGALSERLQAQVATLPQAVRQVSHECYRKRFLYRGELGSIMLADGGLDEGFASWTQDPKFAHRFHGFHRPEAITAAIFAHTPTNYEILLNTVVLWEDAEFRRALEQFVSRNGPNSDALMKFRANQGEVILHVPLRWNEIVGLSGIGDAFDDIADAQGIIEAARAPILRDLMEVGIYPGEPRWIWGNRAHLLLNGTRNRVVDMINAALESRQEDH
jgi:hypothetical protein